jgi:hypothetical protein
MKLIQVASHVLSAVSATVLLTVIGANQAQALSEVQLPANFAIENANNRSMVVDKFGDNPSTAANAHQYSKENPRTYTLFANRSSNGSYEVHLASAPNLCFTMAGGLNPNQGNGTLAVFSGDCNNSLNLRFFDDGTVRVARNTNLCLTNQGNRFKTMFNKLHFWACDGSDETKFNFASVGGVITTNTNVVIQQNVTPQVVVNKPIVWPSTNVMTLPRPIPKYLRNDVNNIINNAPIGALEYKPGMYEQLKIEVASNIVCGIGDMIHPIIGKTCNIANPWGDYVISAGSKPVYHIYPNQLPISWESASKHCQAVYSKPKQYQHAWLVWDEGVKKCISHD